MVDYPTQIVTRILQLNNEPFDRNDNPFGLGDGGHRELFPPTMADIVAMARYMAGVLQELRDLRDLMDLTAAVLKGGPVSQGALDKAVQNLATAEALAVVSRSVAKRAALDGASFTGRVNLAVADLAAPVAGANVDVDFSKANVVRVAPVAAVTLTINAIPEGNDGVLNVVYSSGALSFSGVDRWDLGAGELGLSFAETDIGSAPLVPGAIYQFVFSSVSGGVVGRVGRAK